jgi:metal transporter CNNM
MWLLSPVAWPTAKLLDYLLGEDHGTVYKKAGLKTLVTLHRTLGENTERLNQDEVTIISAVLDLKAKPVGNIMTPISDVFTLSLDTVLDEAMMDNILAEGYSRIPIYAVNNPRDFVGMLLVKMLITYDPEDALRVRDFQLATLPETRPETSCLDIMNFFQEGKSHMVLVSDYPGEPRGALGVLTLEDVIEELIGEEIVDESDVYVDVHKAIRRLKPAPFTRVKRVEKGEVVTDPDPQVPYSEQEGDLDEERRSRRGSRRGSYAGSDGGRKPSLHEYGRSPPAGHTLFLRRRSSGGEAISVRSDTPEMRQHLRVHLGPSNVASRPKSTRINTVKIKPGVDQLGVLPETQQSPRDGRPPVIHLQSDDAIETEDEATETTGLLAGKVASDATHAVGYGAVTSPSAKTKDMTLSGLVRAETNGYQPDETSPLRQSSTQSHEERHSPKSQPSTSLEHSRPVKSSRSRTNTTTLHTPPKLVLDLTPSKEDLTRLDSRDGEQTSRINTDSPVEPTHTDPTSEGGPSYAAVAAADQKDGVPNGPPSRTNSVSTIGSLQSIDSNSQAAGKKRLSARSGSITEQIVEVGGVRKIVLETTSSSDEGDAGASVELSKKGGEEAKADGTTDKKDKKKKRKKRAGKAKKKNQGEEGAPLLGGQS